MNKEEKLIKKEKAHLITLVLMALYFSMLEAFIPKPFPWMKLGLANISTIIAIRNFGSKMGLKVFILRVLIQAFVMGTFLTPTFAISLISGLISTLLMIFLFKYDKIFSVVAVSGISAVVHNISQLIVVYFLMFRGINLYTRSTFIFILVFLVIGFCSGALLGYFVHKYDKKNNVIIQS